MAMSQRHKDAGIFGPSANLEISWLAAMMVLETMRPMSELYACFTDDREFVIFKAQVFMPGYVSMIALGVVEYFTHTGGPVSVLLEKLRHRNGTGSGFSDIKCIVEYAGALRMKAAEKRSTRRPAYRILTKCTIKGDRLIGQSFQVGSGDGFVSGGGNMGV